MAVANSQTDTAPAVATDDGEEVRAVARDAGRSGLLYIAPTGQQARIHERDCLYRRTVGAERQGERFVEYRRLRVTELVERGGRWFIGFDDLDHRLPARDVAAALATGAEWSQTSPEGFDPHGDRWRTWESVRPDERTPSTDLEFEQIAGRGSRKTVNAVLEAVDHRLGAVQKWKAAFVARDATGRIQSVCVTHFYHPSQNGEELCITRLANRPDAPENTSSWILAKVREWAREQDYARLATYSGVDHNAGACYEAAGFEPADETRERDGAAWTCDDDQDTWTRQKWTVTLREGGA